MRGAKVGGRIVPLTYSLNLGDQIEILTSNEAKPRRDWLNQDLGFVSTTRARTKIQAWFRLQDRDANHDEGKALYESELRRLALSAPDIERWRNPWVCRRPKRSMSDWGRVILNWLRSSAPCIASAPNKRKITNRMNCPSENGPAAPSAVHYD